jgi:hypothetical protein
MKIARILCLITLATTLAYAQSDANTCGSAEMPACTEGVDPALQAQIAAAQKLGEACQKDIERFCEGVQVGDGRIEKCLQKHRRKLSKACRKAKGRK